MDTAMPNLVDFEVLAALPPRPVVRRSPNVKSFKDQGLPPNAAMLTHALAQGIFQTAEAIWQINFQTADWYSKRFIDRRQSLIRISNCLMAISPQIRELAAMGRLHEILSNRTDKSLRAPFQYHINLLDAATKHEQPVVYTLVHCTKDGVTPTKAETLRILDCLDEYKKEFDDPNDPRWFLLDQEASKIDNFDAKVIGRDWSDGNRGVSREAWSYTTSGKLKPHPRRYCNTVNSRRSLDTFSQQLRDRLKMIPVANCDLPLPWSIVYTGWTRIESQRVEDHYKHSGKSSAVIYLWEAISAFLYPQRKYKLNSISIVNVIESDDAGVTEHTICILTGSNVEFGGANGKLGGDAGMITIASKEAKKNTWNNGLEALAKQNVYIPNLEDLIARTEMDELHAKYQIAGSEFTNYRAAVQDLEQRVKDLESCQSELVTTCSELFHSIEKTWKMCDGILTLAETQKEVDDIEQEVADL